MLTLLLQSLYSAKVKGRFDLYVEFGIGTS
jgi:hypothetical protein